MAPPKQVNVHQAKTQLSKLLAEVEKGREIIVARDGKPVAKLVPFVPAGKRKLKTGNWRGKIWISPNFDAPLSEEELKAWGFYLLLLDTHCWLWLKAEPDRLPSPLRRRLSRDSTKLVLSVACVLEISIKHVAGRLNPDHNPAMLIAELLEEGVLPPKPSPKATPW